MIKQLFIIRHGKAVSDYDSSSDIDRPLKERGIDDAYVMAERLSNKNIFPDIISSSTAARAIHTATIFARVFELDPSRIILNSDLYLPHPDTVFDIISKANNKINSLMIFGHNPAFTDIANFFLKKKIDNMPTTGIAGFKFEIKDWSGILNHKPIESFFDFPKNI